MIYIAFIYKNSCVEQDSIALQFTEDNRNYVYDSIASGVIPRPENYDRVILTEERLKNTLWVSERK